MGRNQKRGESDVKALIFIIFFEQALCAKRKKIGVWILNKARNLLCVPLESVVVIVNVCQLSITKTMAAT